MVKFVGCCVVIFVLAAGFLAVSPGQDFAGIFEAYRSEPLTHKLAWIVVVLAPLVLIAAVIWLCDSLVRQRRITGVLERRLDGAWQGVREAAKAQVDAEAALHHLAHTDPENAIGAMEQRLTEAERVTQVQSARNEIGDLQVRVDGIRAQQEGLKKRLAPVLDKRRSIEQLFTDLDSRQNDIERALTEIASGDDAIALDLRLKDLMEFIKRGHARCDEIEIASKTMESLKEDYSGLRARLDPFAAAADGVTRRVSDLSQSRDELAAGIDSLQRMSDGSLAERVQKFTDERNKLDSGLSQLSEQFSKLATLRKDVEGLFANFDRVLDVLSISKGKTKTGDADARIEELLAFIKTTQARFDDVEGRMTTFGQLKAKLGELQTRLGPLESVDGGVKSLIEELHDMRERLLARIARLEEADEGGLGGRVKMFTQVKKELEDRVATVTEQVSQLATMRKDIAGLFDKLNSVASDSADR
jgi:chromosome segregation ATPase